MEIVLKHSKDVIVNLSDACSRKNYYPNNSIISENYSLDSYSIDNIENISIKCCRKVKNKIKFNKYYYKIFTECFACTYINSFDYTFFISFKNQSDRSKAIIFIDKIEYKNALGGYNVRPAFSIEKQKNVKTELTAYNDNSLIKQSIITIMVYLLSHLFIVLFLIFLILGTIKHPEEGFGNDSIYLYAIYLPLSILEVISFVLGIIRIFKNLMISKPHNE